MALAEGHAHLGRRTVHVIGQAFHHHRHAVGGKTFVDDVIKVHRLTCQARALFDRALQGVFGHGHLAGLLHHQTQLGIGRRIGTITRSDHDFFGQLAEQPALGIGCQILVFCFPLRAHVCDSYCVDLGGGEITPSTHDLKG